MYEIIEIKKYDFVKYLKNLYLVEDFHKLENGQYRLNYLFRSIRKSNAKLHTNGFYDIYGYLAENIRKATDEEIEFLISRIKQEHPNFDISIVNVNKATNFSYLNEDDCIDYLKSKGYLIYKQA